MASAIFFYRESLRLRIVPPVMLRGYTAQEPQASNVFEWQAQSI